MYLLEKRPGPKSVVSYREVSVIWDVHYKEVLMYLPLMGRARSFKESHHIFSARFLTQKSR